MKRLRKSLRLRPRPVILGLTGSIAMGKSTAAQFLKNLGLPVFNADAAIVHGLLGPRGAALPALTKRFPDVVGAPKVLIVQKLGAQVFADPAALADLEAIIHPFVHSARGKFIQAAARPFTPASSSSISRCYSKDNIGIVL